MQHNAEWAAFLDTLLEKARDTLAGSPEGIYRAARRREIDDFLSLNLTDDQRALVLDILSELEAGAHREADVLYRQGVRDGAWLMGALGGPA